MPTREVVLQVNDSRKSPAVLNLRDGERVQVQTDAGTLLVTCQEGDATYVEMRSCKYGNQECAINRLKPNGKWFRVFAMGAETPVPDRLGSR